MNPPRHVPVMLARGVELLTPALSTDDPVLVDGTLGLGGHAAALLEACPDARLIGLDRDPQALARAGERLARFGDRVTLVEAVYDELSDVLDRLGRPRVQGILLDLGLSSLQIDDPERGFAYAYDAPLDMRMGRQDLTAAEVLNTYSRTDLARILRTYGEERFADRIAGRIVAERGTEPFATSGRLVGVLSDAMPAAVRYSGGHPAKRTFQALRIEVNGELAALASMLPDAVAALAVAGRIAVLAYHSLEDRLVKRLLVARAADRAPRDLPVVPPELGPELRLLTRGAARPTTDEVTVNPRAASARLRGRRADCRMSALWEGSVPPPERVDPARLRPVRSPSPRLARFPFLLVLIGVFGLGMAGLLMLNTTLQNQAFQARALNRQATELAYVQADLKRQLDGYAAPAGLAQRASALGMRPNPHPAFLVLPGGRIVGDPKPVSGQELPAFVVKTPAEVAAEREAVRVQRAAAEAKKKAAVDRRAAEAKKKAAVDRRAAEAKKKKAAAADRRAAEAKKKKATTEQDG